MKYTKGPWMFRGSAAYGRDIRQVEMDDAFHCCWVGVAHGPHKMAENFYRGAPGFPSDEECDGNARLMAAAPAMYELLKMAGGIGAYQFEALAFDLLKRIETGEGDA